MFSEKRVWFSTSPYLRDEDELVLEEAGDIIPSFSIQAKLCAQSVMLSSIDITKLKTLPGFWFPHHKSHISPCSPPRNHPSNSKCNPFYLIAGKSALPESLIILTMEQAHGCKKMELSFCYPLFHTGWVRTWPFLGIWVGCPLQHLLLHSLTSLCKTRATITALLCGLGGNPLMHLLPLSEPL